MLAARRGTRLVCARYKSELSKMGLRSPTDLGMEGVQKVVVERKEKEMAAQRDAMLRELEALKAKAREGAVGDEEQTTTPQPPPPGNPVQYLLVRIGSFCTAFGGMYIGSLALIFTLSDHGVPIPPVEIGRSRIARDPSSVTLSWAPMLFLPALVLSIVVRPRLYSAVNRHIDITKKGLTDYFVVNDTGKQTASRGEHISGITSLRRKPANPRWNEKGGDVSMIFDTHTGAKSQRKR